MKNGKVELTAQGKTLAEVKILRDIFHVDSLSPLLFVRIFLPLNYALDKCIEDNIFIKSHTKINHIIDDLKIFVINIKELLNLT